MKKEGKNEKQSTRTKEHYYLLTCYRIIKEPVFIVSAWLRLILSLEIHMGSHVNVLTLFFSGTESKNMLGGSNFPVYPSPIYNFFFFLVRKKFSKLRINEKPQRFLSVTDPTFSFLLKL